MAEKFQVGADGNSNRYDESICLYVKNRVGGIAGFMASVPLGTGAFCFLKGVGSMDVDWRWCG